MRSGKEIFTYFREQRFSSVYVMEQLSFNLQISFLQALMALLLSCKFSSVLLFRRRRETIYCLDGLL